MTIRSCPVPLDTGSAQISRKLLRSPPLNHILCCFMCEVASDGMQVITLYGGPIPLKQEVS
jgi:hypothetical protein